MVQEVSASRATDPGPPAPASQEEHPVDPPGPVVAAGRVPLDRFLTVVTLSPAEAVLVAGRLLESIDLPHPLDGTPAPDARWVAAVTASGDVEATYAGSRAGAPVAELLGQLVHNARRLPAHPTRAQLVLLRRLEEAAAEPAAEPGVWAETLRRALVENAGADASERVGAQLADLVDAYAHMATSSSVPAVVPVAPGEARTGPHPTGPPPPGPRRRAPARVAPRGRRSRGRSARPRRAPARRAVLAVLLLVVAVAASGYLLNRRADDASADADRPDATTGAPSGTAGADTSKPEERASSQSRPRIETLAPRRAGAVTGVELRQVSDCAPGALCAVTVTARLRPATSAQTVTWRVGTATSCDGSISWSPPVSVTAQPGWTRVYASSSVQVPRRPRVALVATTSAPARAQSPPVPVAGSSLSC